MKCSITSKEALWQPDLNFLDQANIPAFNEWQMHSSLPSADTGMQWPDFLVAQYLQSSLLLGKQWFLVPLFTPF